MIIIKCKLCKNNKSESQFSLFRGRLNKWCKQCRSKNNQWYAQDLNGKRTKAKTYYQKNKDRVAKYRSVSRLQKRYKLTEQAYKEMLLQQNNHCLICEIDFTGIKPCVDHNHETGKVRSLLCRKCNLWLQVVENEQFVKKAQSYLESMK